MADAVWSRMGLPMFTHSVEACELCSVGVNSGALGLRLEVVDSVAGGGMAVAPLAGSPRLVDPLEDTCVVFSVTLLATTCRPAISTEMSSSQA